MHGYVHVSACAHGGQRLEFQEMRALVWVLGTKHSPLQRQYIVLTLQPHFSVFDCLFFETGSQPMLSYLAEGDLELLIFMFSPPNHWEYRCVPLNPGTVAHVNQSILTYSRSLISVVSGTHLSFSTEKMLCKQISSEGPGYKPHNQTHICTLYITYTFLNKCHWFES